MFDSQEGKESSNYNVENLSQPINDKHSIALSSYAYFRNFHAVRANHSWNASGYHPSCLAPTRNTLSDKILTAQSNTVCYNANNFVDVINKSYCQIKLYNKTSMVYLRGHKNDTFDCDCFYEAGFHGYPAIYSHTTNKCPIDEIKNSFDFKWNDLVDSNGKAKYSTKYQSIGNYNYCNWACGARFGDTNFSKRADYDTNLFESETNLFGPAGACLIFSIQNNWELNELPVTAYFGDRKSFLFSDTIGTDRIDVTTIKHSGYVGTPKYDYIVKHKSIKTKIKGQKYIDYVSDTKRNFSPVEVLTQNDKENNYYIAYNALIPDSIAGTYISNIRKQTTPYGGYSFDAISNTKYYSSGDIFNVYRDENGELIKEKNSNIIFNGDCYIAPFEYTSLHKYYTPTDVPMTMNITYNIPVESNINVMRNHGITLSKDFDKYDEFAITNIQQDSSNVKNKFQQNKPEYEYNSVYSSPNKTMLHLSLSNIAKSTSVYNLDTRTRYSEQKSNKEQIDSWLKFKPANYIDVDGKHGEITHLDIFNDNLIFFQTNAVGRFAVNDRVTLQDVNNMSIVLGTGGVLERYDYITEQNGMYKNQYSSVSTEHGLYWYDAIRNEILRFSLQGGVSIISKEKTVQNLLNIENIEDVEKIDGTLYYDKKYNEIHFNIYERQNKSLIFNEQTQAFTSEYSTSAISWFGYIKDTYFAQQNKLYTWDKDNTVNDASLTYIINPHAELVKVYDTQKLGISVYQLSGVQISQVYRTDVDMAEDNNIKYSNREGDIRLAVPRANNQKFGGRLRGKTVNVSLRLKGNLNYVSISNIITKYRISWS